MALCRLGSLQTPNSLSQRLYFLVLLKADHCPPRALPAPTVAFTIWVLKWASLPPSSEPLCAALRKTFISLSLSWHKNWPAVENYLGILNLEFLKLVAGLWSRWISICAMAGSGAPVVKVSWVFLLHLAQHLLPWMSIKADTQCPTACLQLDWKDLSVVVS